MYAKLELIGNLTADPVVKEVTVRGEKRKVTEVSIAVNNPFNKDAEPSFYNNLAAWNGTGETLARFCTKGSQVFVSCDIEMRRDEKDGVKRTHLNGTIKELRLLSSRRESDSRYENAPPSEAEQAAAPVADTPTAAVEAPVATETPVEEPAAEVEPEQESIPVPF